MDGKGGDVTRGKRSRTGLGWGMATLLICLLAGLAACSDTQEVTVFIDDRVSQKPRLKGVEITVLTPALGQSIKGHTDISGVWVGHVPCFSDLHPQLKHRVSTTYQGQSWKQEFTTNRDNCATKRSVIFMWVKRNSGI